MIIGVTGHYASGKRTLSEYLVRKGFEHLSLSDEIRKEARRKSIPVTTANLIQLGNQMREKYGPAVWAERVRQKIEDDKDYVISSFRNAEEVKVFENMPQFVFISVVADAKRRYELVRSREKDEENDEFKSFEEFLDNEKAEKSSEPYKQQIHKCHKMAKIIINNDGTIDDFYQKIEQMVSSLKKKYFKRPGWDEYFLGIVDAVSRRATCDRGRTAVLIVREKRILATGYVGSPMGQPHCDESGHIIKKLVHEDGSITQHCVRTNHAEVNAVALAARNGIAIDEATLYCKLAPCFTCAKMLVNAGIKRIVCQKRYHVDGESMKLFKSAGIEVAVVDDKVEKYKEM